MDLKSIEVSLSIKDPAYVYSNQDVILSMLKDKYEGKCSSNCYIKKIIKITNTSPCYVETFGNNLESYINVVFLAKIIVYEKNDILFDCKICYIGDENVNTMILMSEKSRISSKNDPMLKSLNIKQIIPIKVRDSIYKLNSTHISVTGVPYFPEVTIPLVYYRITGNTKVNLQDIKNLDPLIQKMKKTEIKDKELFGKNQKGYEFFLKFLSPYKIDDIKSFKKKMEDKNEKENIKSISINNLIGGDKLDNYYYFINGNTLTNDNNIYYKEKLDINDSDSNDPNNIACVKLELSDFIAKMIINYIKRLKSMRSIMNTYKDEKILKAHTNLIKAFLIKKIDL